MATYWVETAGECREMYLVEADSPEDAMARWHEGEHLFTEAMSVEPINAGLEPR